MADLLWAERCASKWNMNRFTSSELGAANFRLLYPLAWPICSKLKSRDEDISFHGDTVAIFNGIVGNGNRSVQSVTPFFRTEMAIKSTCICGILNNLVKKYFLAIACAAKFSADSLSPTPSPRCPYVFSTPFRDVLHKDKLILQPRHIAYYELRIDRLQKKADSTSVADADVECIAIGLAAEDFRLEKRLPGTYAISIKLELARR